MLEAETKGSPQGQVPHVWRPLSRGVSRAPHLLFSLGAAFLVPFIEQRLPVIQEHRNQDVDLLIGVGAYYGHHFLY